MSPPDGSCTIDGLNSQVFLSSLLDGGLPAEMKRLRVVLPFSILLAGCLSVWSPGEDPRGRDLLADGDQLVSALQQFRANNGSYPADLEALDSGVELGRPGSDFYFSYEVLLQLAQSLLMATAAGHEVPQRTQPDALVRGY